MNPHFNPLEPPEDALPPAEVRITDLRAEPWPDGQRIRVMLTLTPFLERPNLSAAITSPSGEEVASASVVETTDIQIVFTLHIREDLQPGLYTLSLGVDYPDLGVLTGALCSSIRARQPINRAASRLTIAARDELPGRLIEVRAHRKTRGRAWRYL